MNVPLAAWQYLTLFGDIAFMLPLAATIALYLRSARAPGLAIHWGLYFLLTMSLVVLSKLAFIGWGFGIASLDFTGFSGHATRVCVLLPVLAVLAMRDAPRQRRYAVTGSAIACALLISYSRIVVHAHSMSEAVSGAALGFSAAWRFLRIAQRQRLTLPGRWLLRASAIGLLLPLACFPMRGTVATPTQALLTQVALSLSGHSRPHTRADWHATRSSNAGTLFDSQIRN